MLRRVSIHVFRIRRHSKVRKKHTKKFIQTFPRLSLRRRPSSATAAWSVIVETGPKGGTQTVLLPLEVNEEIGVFLDTGTLISSPGPKQTFSGFRIAQKWSNLPGSSKRHSLTLGIFPLSFLFLSSHKKKFFLFFLFSLCYSFSGNFPFSVPILSTIQKKPSSYFPCLSFL